MTPPRAAIAGAGIAGLCAALCLARHGWRVSLYEKARFLDEAGAGLQLSPNASSILQRLGITDRLAPSALCPKAITVRRARDGAALASLPLKDQQRRWSAPYLAVHRADLQRVLLEAAAVESGISLTLGKAVVGFEPGKDSVSVEVTHGPVTMRTSADCLIGADGVRSFVRQGLGYAKARFTGLTAWRALVEAGHVPAAMREEETVLWLGHGAHLVHYPLRGGTVVNVVAIVDEDFRPQEHDYWSSPGDAGMLEAFFSGWDRRARELLHAAPGWRKWPLFDSRPITNWGRGRVTLMGDAAHPMLPFLAQGAAQAIEDAYALGMALEQTKSTEAGLAAYQRARHARATRVQTESRRQAAIYHLSGPAAYVRDLILRAMGGQKMLARYDWLYGA